MFVAAILTSKEGSPPCPFIGSLTVFNTKILIQDTGFLLDSFLLQI